MTVAIVESFEMIEVYKEDSTWMMVALGALIRQSGKRIGDCESGQFIMCGLQFVASLAQTFTGTVECESSLCNLSLHDIETECHGADLITRMHDNRLNIQTGMCLVDSACFECLHGA